MSKSRPVSQSKSIKDILNDRKEKMEYRKITDEKRKVRSKITDYFNSDDFYLCPKYTHNIEHINEKIIDRYTSNGKIQEDLHKRNKLHLH